MNTARLQKLETYQLMQGSHSDFEGGMCAMEFVAWLAEEPHSDAPDCACPVLAAFMRTWNDSLVACTCSGDPCTRNNPGY